MLLPCLWPELPPDNPMAAGRLRLPCCLPSEENKQTMHKNIKTVAGCFTNVTCNVSASDGREVKLTAYIAIGQERRPVPKKAANILVFPAVEYGQHLYEIRADGKPFIFGFLIVRPSAFPVAEGTVDYTLNATLDSVDALHVDIELTPGPRGYSAYDIAVMEGFEGSEAEWLEHMRQQTATLAVEQVTPLMQRAETAANKAEQEAAAAQRQQEAAGAHAVAANGCALAAHASQQGAEAARADAEAAANAAAGKFAETLKSMKVAQEAAENAETYMQTAASHAELAAEHKQAAAKEVTKAAAEVEKAALEKQAAAAEAGAAAQSAADAQAAKAAAEKAKADALAAQIKAEQESQKAADNAALLGDAALQGGDNTFTGANVFDGTLSGNGTLYGMPLQHLYGKAAMLSGCVVKSEDMLKSIFPEHAEMTVLPPCEWKVDGFDGVNLKNIFPKLEYVFCEGDKVTGTWIRGMPHIYNFSKIKEYWLVEKGTGTWSVKHTCAWKSYLFFPIWKNSAITIYIHNAKSDGICNSCKLYVPLAPTVTIGIEHYSSDYRLSEFEFLGENSIKTLTIGNSKTRMRLINGVFPSCTNLNIKNNILLERESLLTMLTSLPAYDAATMTAQPTASVYIDPELQGDTDVEAALLNLQTAVEDGGKGWTVAITGIMLGGAATFGLRKVYYYARREDADGSYIDEAGQRWDISGGTTVLRANEANEQVPGYAAFLSLEDALEQWGLHEITPEESKADYERRYGGDDL